jgi:hypothetical protein
MADPDFLKDSQKSLWNHKIPHLPDSFYYIPNFLGDVECSALLQKVRSSSPVRVSIDHFVDFLRFLQTDGHSYHIGDCRLGRLHSPQKTPLFPHHFLTGSLIRHRFLIVLKNMEFLKGPGVAVRIMFLSMNITQAKGLCHMKMGQLMNQLLRPLA